MKKARSLSGYATSRSADKDRMIGQEKGWGNNQRLVAVLWRLSRMAITSHLAQVSSCLVDWLVVLPVVVSEGAKPKRIRYKPISR